MKTNKYPLLREIMCGGGKTTHRMTYLSEDGKTKIVIPVGASFYATSQQIYDENKPFYFSFYWNGDVYHSGIFGVDIRISSIFRNAAKKTHRRNEIMAIIDNSELIEGEKTLGNMRLAHIESMLEAIDMGDRKQKLPAWKILVWHKNMFPAGGMLRETHAHSTTGHTYPEPVNLYAKMEKILELDETRPGDVWLYIARKHYQLADLHPFADGNGRIARLFTNWMSVYLGQNPIRVCYQHRNEYISALEKVDMKKLARLFENSQVNW